MQIVTPQKKIPTEENLITYNIVLRAAAEYMKGEGGKNRANSMTSE